MAQCNAPVYGHIRGGGADCPVHGGRYGGYSGYRDPYYQRPAYTPPPVPVVPVVPPEPKRYPSFTKSSGGSSGGVRSAGGGGRRTSTSSRARRSAVTYSVREYRVFSPVREQVEQIATKAPDRRDLFLCHAWDDRRGDALQFYNLLTGLDVKVWFSEKDLPLGTPFMRQIDKGLANSRAGIVLVTPALLASLESEGVAEKELSVLLGTGRVIPIAHGTTFDALREISPMLASHHGITTSEYASLEEVATKIADTVLVDDE
jgi:hypothetical protein